ncbi:MAG: HNH endonuclease [Gemmatimonadetes bacterium]|nr:HNH endonuclease [Gemmatimonadota bacterium]
MRTYLLTWNPGRAPGFADDIAEFTSSGGLIVPWSCGRTKRITVGDRLFLMQLGVEERGVIGSARAVSAPYEDDHWDADRAAAGDTALFVDAEFGDLRGEPVIGLAELSQRPFTGMNWTPQASGIEIPELQAKALAALWHDRMGGGSPSAKLGVPLPPDRADWYSAEDYVEALGRLGPAVTAKQRAMLRAHCEAPGRVLTVTQLAAAAGYARPEATYSQYGRLGSLLSRELGHGAETVATRMIGDDFRSAGGEVTWVMEPALARALVTLGWSRSAAAPPNLVGDVLAISATPRIGATQREALLQCRLGQGAFRRALLDLWKTCAVTGVAEEAALVASHIKPWHASTNEERLDPANGLLLVANIDALFDRGLVSFQDNGEMLIADRLHPGDCALLGLTASMRLRWPPLKSARYLAFHRRCYGFSA